jgi:hypothetical protein
MADARFTATLLEGHKGAAVEVPFDPAERWGVAPERLQPGRRGHRVTGTIEGFALDSVVVGRSRKFFVLVDEDLRQRAKLAIGDRARVVLRLAPNG